MKKLTKSTKSKTKTFHLRVSARGMAGGEWVKVHVPACGFDNSGVASTHQTTEITRKVTCAACRATEAFATFKGFGW